MGVLVTGGAGYIGSHMVLALIDAGEKVVVLDDLSSGFRWAVPEGAEFVQGDIGDSELIRRLLLRNQIEAIIHFAGSIVVQRAALHLLVDGHGLWRARHQTNSRGIAAGPGLPLRQIKTHDRGDVA
jgi:UDP-glucose 4-epimerase